MGRSVFAVIASIDVGQFDGKFTFIAGKAMDFATLFNVSFTSPLPGPVPYRIELTTPVGPSTAGGKQALQHIRLVPADGGPAIVAGSCSPVARSAELRTYRQLADLHAMRFKGARFPIAEQPYDEFLRRLQQFFSVQGHAVVMLDVPQPSTRTPAPTTEGPTWPWIVLSLLVIVGIGLAALLLFGFRHAP